MYTGVGKINAAMTTANVIREFAPDSIINFGSAGALRGDLKGLYEVTVFKQRDMDATSLGFALGETPYDDIETISFSCKGLSCGSGDSFVDSMPDLNTDLVDMEAYVSSIFLTMPMRMQLMIGPRISEMVQKHSLV